MENANSFITNIIEDLHEMLRQRFGSHLNNLLTEDSKLSGNLFRLFEECNIVTLKEVILNEIDAYYEKFQEQALLVYRKMAC